MRSLKFPFGILSLKLVFRKVNFEVFVLKFEILYLKYGHFKFGISNFSILQFRIWHFEVCNINFEMRIPTF